MRRTDVIEQIVKADLCTGCGGCAALFPDVIEMRTSDAGFPRATQKTGLSRQAARDVLQLCPGFHQAGLGAGEQKHPLWGAFEGVYEGWASDPELRHAGASGGALSAMLGWLLQTGQVDAVLSIAADPENPLGNRTVLSATPEEIIAQAASRYAPSQPLGRIAELLKTSGRYAFVGKPCDVAGLRNWAKLDPEIDARFPIKLSFFCAGVPSLTGAEAVSQELGIAPKDLRAFRYRGQGWPGRTVAVSRTGEAASMAYAESWGGILSKHVQPRCRICADGIGLAADIAFADAWETDAAGYPLFEEKEGRSLVIARTALGMALLEGASNGGMVELVFGSIDKTAPMQPGQLRRRRELLGRLTGRVLAGRPIPRYRDMKIWRNGMAFGVWPSLRAAFGMMRRCLSRPVAKP